MKYPKLEAAIDDFLAKQVAESGEDLIAYALAVLSAPAPEPVKPAAKEEAKQDAG